MRRRGGSSIAGQREYAIKHALTREVAYASIPKARRGRLHAALGDWLAATERATDEHAAFLRYHYSEAVRPRTSTSPGGRPAELASSRAGGPGCARQLARARYEMDEAIELSPVLRSWSTARWSARLWREIGLCNALRYDGEAFWAGMQRSLEAALPTA